MLVVRRHRIPWRPGLGRRTKAFLVGEEIIVPAIALVEIAEIELPVLLGFVDSLEKALQAVDREVFRASSADQAMALSREHDFAFVLLDVQIPTLDGFTLAELMRGTERSSATPIVLLTAASPDAPLPVFRGFDSAAVDVLFKPVNPDLLRQKAKLFVEFYRQKQDLARALRAREDVLAIVSHDMRTPLAVVHTTTSMLLNPKYKLGPEQIREQHERIRRNVDLMNRMIGDLLTTIPEMKQATLFTDDYAPIETMSF